MPMFYIVVITKCFFAMSENISDVHTISMASSEISWNDVDDYWKSIGFKDRSKYVQYLIEKDMYRTKRDFKSSFIIILLLFLAMVSLMILLKVGV